MPDLSMPALPRDAAAWRRRLLQGVALGLVLPWGLQACGRKPEVRESLVIAEAGTAAMGLLYIAQDQGFFSQEGLTVTLQRHASGRDAFAAVLAGKADAGTPYDGPVVVNINRGEPIRVLATLALAPGETMVLARRDRRISNPADLRGKRIAIIASTNAEYLMSVLLGSVGLQPTDVVYVPLQPDESVAALMDGRVDAMANWSPYWQTARDQLGADQVSLFTSPDFLEIAMLCTTAPLLKARRPVFGKLLRALLRAEAFKQQQHDAAFQSVSQALASKITPEVLRERWALNQLLVRLDHRLLTSLENESRWFAEHAGVGVAPPSLRPYLVDDLLRPLRPQAVTLPIQP